jgi:hypothetical protein
MNYDSKNSKAQPDSGYKYYYGSSKLRPDSGHKSDYSKNSKSRPDSGYDYGGSKAKPNSGYKYDSKYSKSQPDSGHKGDDSSGSKEKKSSSEPTKTKFLQDYEIRCVYKINMTNYYRNVNIYNYKKRIII